MMKTHPNFTAGSIQVTIYSMDRCKIMSLKEKAISTTMKTNRFKRASSRMVNLRAWVDKSIKTHRASRGHSRRASFMGRGPKVLRFSTGKVPGRMGNCKAWAFIRMRKKRSMRVH